MKVAIPVSDQGNCWSTHQNCTASPLKEHDHLRKKTAFTHRDPTQIERSHAMAYTTHAFREVDADRDSKECTVAKADRPRQEFQGCWMYIDE